MTSTKELSPMDEAVRQYNEARQRAAQLLEESRADGIDETRRAELIASATEAMDEADRLRAETEAHTRLSELAEMQVERRELSPVIPGQGRRNTDREAVATEVEIRERRDAVNRRVMGMELSDEERAVSSRRFHAERLFPQRLAEILAGHSGRLSESERAEWEAHQEIMERAIGSPMGHIDSYGADLVPDFLVPQIFAGRSAIGAMATEERLSVFRGQMINSKYTLPFIADPESLKAIKHAEGADGNTQRVTTSSVTLDPNKYRVAVPVNSELLVGDYVGFEQWLTGRVGAGFGMMFNETRTLGDGGSGNVQGITAGGKTVTSGNKTAQWLTADIRDMLSGLNSAYASNAVVQLNRDSIFKILELNRASGNGPAYIVNPANAMPILPGAPEILENPNLKAKGDISDSKFSAGDPLMIFGDLREYAVLMAGPMRVYRQFFSLSDQWLLSWYQSHDGRIINDAAFTVLEQGA